MAKYVYRFHEVWHDQLTLCVYIHRPTFRDLSGAECYHKSFQEDRKRSWTMSTFDALSSNPTSVISTLQDQLTSGIIHLASEISSPRYRHPISHISKSTRTLYSYMFSNILKRWRQWHILHVSPVKTISLSYEWEFLRLFRCFLTSCNPKPLSTTFLPEPARRETSPALTEEQLHLGAQSLAHLSLPSLELKTECFICNWLLIAGKKFAKIS